MADTVQDGPLVGWPLVKVGDGEIAVGRHSWCRMSGTFSVDEAWRAWRAYWQEYWQNRWQDAAPDTEGTA